MVEDTQKRYADDVTVQELVRLRVENERLREDLIEAEKYNGYHQQACLEIERLREALKQIADHEVCLCEQKQMQTFARAALKGDE